MNSFLRNSLLAVSVVLSLGITPAGISSAGQAGDSSYSGEFSATEYPQSASVYPVNGPDLFGIQRTGSSAIDLLRNLPASNSVDNPDSKHTPGYHIEKLLRRSVSAYLAGSKTIERSQTTRRLLFPFHHFL